MSHDHQETQLHGLSTAEVAERVDDGRVNVATESTSRTFSEIFRANVFTPINAIIGTFFVLIMIAGPGPDALFAGVVIANSTLGIAQELRARSTLDKLAVLNSPHVTAIRDSEPVLLDVENIVADDLLSLRPGDQIVVDGEVTTSRGLQIDESLLTGEADAVEKALGDEVLSGSFVSGGSGTYRAVRLGAESYAATLASEARTFKLSHSELRAGINQILRWLTFIIPPATLLLLLSLLDSQERWQDALVGTVAAGVAMVPDGLVLLTSLAMIVGVLELAKRNALAKELISVELLARVSVLCLDKTGTITTGNIVMASVQVLNDASSEAHDALGALAHAEPTPNATLAAIGAQMAAPDDWTATAAVPFTSARKWASTEFGERGTWYLGAPEMLLAGSADPSLNSVRTQAQQGHRVLLLAKSASPVHDEQLPEDLLAVALVLLDDEIRSDAPEIFAFLRKQGIQLKVISGDHPETVSAVARRAGIQGAESVVDARTLSSEPGELEQQMEDFVVFGRVTPHQKRAMVGALQNQGEIVAMTGDGVNDVLALKDADMGIAMGSGSDATRSVAQLVLLDDRFSTLPTVLAQGRQIINNIERVANLFVVKATYAVLITVAIGLMRIEFPFLPRHLTLVGSISIGIPGFFLAMYPNSERARTGFLSSVLHYSLPAGTAMTAITMGAYLILRDDATIPLDEARTGAVVVILTLGLVVLAQLATPLTPSRSALIGAMSLGLIGALNIPWIANFFELVMPPTSSWAMLAAFCVAGGVALMALPRLFPEWYANTNAARIK
jgi:cation-transporting P-type ATPase E